jgi:large conductance mechanosensitive channel
MSLAKEFKEFAMKGSVVDLAIGVIIGAAFGKIVSSLVEDIIMPPLGKVIGGVNFTDLAVSLGSDPAGKEVLWKYGNFLQISFQFLIVAFVLFMLIRGINKLKKPDPAAGDPRPAREEVIDFDGRRSLHLDVPDGGRRVCRAWRFLAVDGDVHGIPA